MKTEFFHRSFHNIPVLEKYCMKYVLHIDIQLCYDKSSLFGMQVYVTSKSTRPLSWCVMYYDILLLILQWGLCLFFAYSLHITNGIQGNTGYGYLYMFVVQTHLDKYMIIKKYSFAI